MGLRLPRRHGHRRVLRVGAPPQGGQHRAAADPHPARRRVRAPVALVLTDMTSFAPPASSGRVQAMRQAAGRVPLRIKLVAALLALVVIALAVISMVGLAEFRSYQQGRVDAQLVALSDQIRNSGIGALRSQALSYEGYVIELRDAQQRQVGCTQCTLGDLTVSHPNVPTSESWLATNDDKLVTVPAMSGGDSWRVLVRPQIYSVNSGPFMQNLTGTLILGADLGHLDQAAGRLAKVDLVVSAIIVFALAIVGVAMVRASLRPLADIEETAEAIAAGDLSRRVPYHDPRTEMGRLATSLNVMLAHVESAFRARAQSEAAARQSEERMRRFLADASHELRTPLTAIRGYAEYYRQRGGVKNGPAAIAPATAEAATAEADAAPAAHASAVAAPGAALGSLADPSARDEPLTRQDMDRIME